MFFSLQVVEHTGWPTGRSSGGKEWQQLKEHMGEAERLQSNVARDAAAVQAMGFLWRPKLLNWTCLVGMRLHDTNRA